MKTPPCYIHEYTNIQTLDRYFAAIEISICCTLHIDEINLLHYKYSIRSYGTGLLQEYEHTCTYSRQYMDM